MKVLIFLIIIFSGKNVYADCYKNPETNGVSLLRVDNENKIITNLKGKESKLSDGGTSTHYSYNNKIIEVRKFPSGHVSEIIEKSGKGVLTNYFQTVAGALKDTQWIGNKEVQYPYNSCSIALEIDPIAKVVKYEKWFCTGALGDIEKLTEQLKACAQLETTLENRVSEYEKRYANYEDYAGTNGSGKNPLIPGKLKFGLKLSAPKYKSNILKIMNFCKSNLDSDLNKKVDEAIQSGKNAAKLAD